MANLIGDWLMAIAVVQPGVDVNRNEGCRRLLFRQGSRVVARGTSARFRLRRCPLGRYLATILAFRARRLHQRQPRRRCFGCFCDRTARRRGIRGGHVKTSQSTSSFTNGNLPIVFLEAKEPIVSERKVPCTVKMILPKGAGLHTNALPGAVRFHGATSQQYPKNNWPYA
jgi:hypothetical protein